MKGKAQQIKNKKREFSLLLLRVRRTSPVSAGCKTAPIVLGASNIWRQNYKHVDATLHPAEWGALAETRRKILRHLHFFVF
jgi:hypothetical protein